MPPLMTPTNQMETGPTCVLPPPQGTLLSDTEMSDDKAAYSHAPATASCASLLGGHPTTARENTAIVFDWDDTLFSSTAIAFEGTLSQIEDVEITPEMQQLETSVYHLLSLAADCGTVFIITNAEKGWVEYSASRFYPRLMPLLEKVTVMSARTAYEPTYAEPSEWKIRAFAEQIHANFPSLEGLNLISVGDGEFERGAIHIVGRAIESSLTKSIKFVAKPSVEQLRRQVELVCSYLPCICEHTGDLDLMLTINLLS